MGRSMKEKALMAMVAVVALYALAACVWFFSAKRSWTDARRAYDGARRTYQKEVALIKEKRKWTEAYEAEKASIPMFEPGKATDTTWLRKLGKIAEQNRIVISNAQAGKEVEAGDVLQLPIEVRTWEGCLESLVKFLYELENTSEGMFDIAQIRFSPNNSKKGYLRGSFTLNCAYMRKR